MDKNQQTDIWAARWNDRYSQEAFAYGEEPNKYLQNKLASLTAGSILFPAEGEGRNAVYAAKLGWSVAAFDISTEGQKKALQLAEKNKVEINYKVGELESLNFSPEQFDAIALIYAHFPPNIKSKYHQLLDGYLKINGTFIFEAFSKKHIEYVTADERVGGPKDIDTLFSIDEIKADFPNYEMLVLEECEIQLNEGLFHNGTGSVIRCIGKKIKHRHEVK